jgi:endogenous inhibitor of DNA gyrase (YacG/DUF329 family)
MSHHGREDEREDFEPAYDQACADRDAAYTAIRDCLKRGSIVDLQHWAVARGVIPDPDAKRKAAEKRLADARFAVTQAERDLKAVTG